MESSSCIISVMTLNVWVSNGTPVYWPEREEPIKLLMDTFQPDILTIQESHPTILNALIDNTSFHFIQNADNGIDWDYPINILWNSSKFDLLEKRIIHLSPSTEDSDNLPYKSLALMIKLIHKSSLQEFVVCTTHLPWCGCEEEVESGLNVRIPLLKELLRECEQIEDPLILTGDFNEDFHPLRILEQSKDEEEDGDGGSCLVNCFAQLRVPPPITHPCRPSSQREEERVRNNNKINKNNYQSIMDIFYL